MRSALTRVFPGLLLVSLSIPPLAAAAELTVPTAADPDVQSAVGHLAAGADVENTIYITSPSITTNSRIAIGAAYNGGHHLTIRPATTLGRAQILSTDLSGQPIFDLTACGSVQLQDLDIVRVITNNGDLIRTDHTTFMTIERCRIGSSGAPNAPGLSYMVINYPADGGMTIRNCIFFSTYKTAFAFGIQASMGDVSNALYLYNDCIADYDVLGLHVNDFVVGSLMLARNNVFVNNTVSAPEPTAVSSQIGDGVIVVTSDNLAFASAVKVQIGSPPNQDLFGTSASQVPVDLPGTLLEENSAFSTMAWNATPGAANSDFYRTLAGGPLHVPSAYGIICGLKSPDIHDQAVIDDINRSIRPGGSPLHVDRGPYQVDPSTSGVGERGGDTALLRVAPEENPARTLRFAYTSGRAGELNVEVFDVEGRRVATLQRAVSAGESGVLEWPGERRAGVYVYRARLRVEAGTTLTRGGRVSVVK